jgi:pimeloyl-ACP methyl ester carboxylesterase
VSRPVTTATFREGSIETAGARLRYREAGQGKPLLHVTADGAVAAHGPLLDAFRFVIVEPPTSGAAALVALADRLGLESFDVVASGAAAPVALGLALAAPSRVSALVLEAPTGIDGALEARLAEVAAPTLVLLGTRDDAGAAAARLCQARVANGHLVLVYDAGTAIAAERPAAFVEVVSDFLERHEAFVISRARTLIHP